MKILLVDCGTKLPSLALMRLSTYHKSFGHLVHIMNFGDSRLNPSNYDRVYVSVIFTRDQERVEKFAKVYGDKVKVGGPGWKIPGHLPPEVEACRPDYDLYTAELLYPRIKGPYSRQTRMEKAQQVVDSGLGRLSVGCKMKCKHCLVPKIEGELREGSPLESLINPRSKVIHLLDNSLGDLGPRAIELLAEAKQLGLVINLSQGINIRTASPEFLAALCRADLWAQTIYIAWDRMQDEHAVLAGIARLKPLADAHGKSITAFLLTKFDTSFGQDQYRVAKLHELGVRPFVMCFDQTDKHDARMAKFKRFVNAFFHKRMDFETEYEPWLAIKNRYQGELFAA